MMGKKRTELQFLQESVERKQAEINQLIRDTEAELSSNKRDIKVSTHNKIHLNCIILIVCHFLKL